MTKRNPVLVVALTLFTFTLYAYWWLYATTAELAEETGRDDLHPLADVLLAALTFGLWGWWAAYRNARIVHEEMVERGAKHTDRSVAVAAFGALTLFTGWTWLVGMALLQEDMNRLAETDFDYFAEAPPLRSPAAEPARARVEVEPTEPRGASRWEDAPSVPVFRSNAPMPNVY